MEIKDQNIKEKREIALRNFDLSEFAKTDATEFVMAMNLDHPLDKAQGIAGGFDTPEEVLQLLKKKLGHNNISIWVTYDLKTDKDVPPIHNRMLYQWLCYGYLYFYDFQVKDPKDPLHTIFFYWHKKMVSIFITPAHQAVPDGTQKTFILKTPPAPVVSDPPPPPPPPPPNMG